MSPIEEIHIDDIRTEYIPQSQRPPETSRFEDYQRYRRSIPVPVNNEPWKPGFETLEDFELAEICLEGALNAGLCKRLIALFHKCLNGGGVFTLDSFDKLQSSWNLASQRLTPVRSLTVRA